MFYAPLAALTWILSGWIVDRKRLRELLTYGLFGAVLATAHDRLVILYQLWEYRDTGLADSHAEIALLISLSAAPVFAMRFAQGLSAGRSFPVLRAVKFTAIAMIPEVIGLQTGHIVYDHWWNASWSVIAYGPIWLSIWALHRWLSPAPAVARQRLNSGP
ncbi:MAG: CBO0543 family protein [Bacillota bacterium]